MLIVPELVMEPGRWYCLHIPPGFFEYVGDVEQAVRDAGQGTGLVVERAKFAGEAPGWIRLFRRQTTRNWLAQAAGISEEEAAREIAALPAQFHQDLSCNPGTPRTMLGLCASRLQRPGVLIYDTAGLDPSGCVSIHRFLSEHAANLCAVHISWSATDGAGNRANRHCPENAVCIELRRPAVRKLRLIGSDRILGQWEGELDDGRILYIHVTYGDLSYGIGATIEEAIDNVDYDEHIDELYQKALSDSEMMALLEKELDFSMVQADKIPPEVLD